ncbi:MAG: cytochrome P450 [Chloroflexia bacterium]
MTTAAATREIPTLPGVSAAQGRREFRTNLLGFLTRAGREGGDICWLPVGSRRILFLNAPEYIGRVLAEGPEVVEKPSAGGAARTMVIGNGLITSDGAFHQRQRRLCAPAFAPRRIAAYDGLIAEAVERAAAGWSQGAELDLGGEVSRLTLDIAGRALFGADLLSEAEDLRGALLAARQFVQDQAAARLRVPLGWPAPRNLRFRAAVTRLDATIYRLIEERRSSPSGRPDLLSLLLAAQAEEFGAGMTPKQVRDEAVNLFWAGHEPTAIALTAALYYLAQHATAYARVREEAGRVLGERAPTASDMPALAYTGQVFKEVLRLCPPIFAFGRRLRQPLEVGGYELPAGTDLMISPYALHRRPAVFPDPEAFDAGRFSPEDEAGRHRLDYLPFGLGPRVCIGSYFATLTATLALAILARRVTFELLPGPRPTAESIVAQPGKDRIRVVVGQIFGS